MKKGQYFIGSQIYNVNDDLVSADNSFWYTVQCTYDIYYINGGDEKRSIFQRPVQRRWEMT